MKILTSVLLIFIICASAYSQNFWFPTSVMSGGNDNVQAIESIGPDIVLAYSQNAGLYRSTNSGGNWIFSGFTGKRVYSIKTAPNGNIFTVSGNTTGLYISRSTDNGASWQDVMTHSRTNNYAGGGGIVFVNDSVFVAAISVTVGPTIGDIAGFIYRTTNHGASWVQIYTLFTGFTNDLVLTRTGKILAATSLGGVKASTDNGTTWQNTGYNIYSYRLAVNSLGHAFVARWTAGDTINMVFKSTDDGVLWSPVNCTGRSIRAFIIDSLDRMYVANEDKIVKRSSDEGNSWTDITAGIPVSDYVYAFSLGSNGLLYAGTTSSGVYRSGQVVSAGENQQNVPSGYELKQNYPNPFNPVTTIEYSIPQTAFVSVKVFDISGKEVKVLVNGIKQSGIYGISFDASSFASGIYFYRIESGSFTETKKMMLIK